MNVINISQNFEVKGGSDVYFHLLTKLLTDNGYDVKEFASTKNPNEIFPDSINFERKTPYNISKYIYNFEAKNKLKKFLETDNFDIAHLHIYYGKLSASILSPLKKLDIPIVQTLHEYKLVCPTYRLHDGSDTCFACKNNNFYKSVSKKCNRGSLTRTALSAIESYVSLIAGSQTLIDHFITVSEFQKTQIVKMGFNPEKITTVHNFVNIEDYPLISTSQTGEYVFYFGRIEKIKGIEIMLKAFELLPERIKLVIVGDGEYKDEMLRYIQRSNTLSKKVIYKGFLKGKELSESISKAKFVIVPSIWFETFGLTVVEAMAYGKPVIGSNIGGITEIIDHGVDGYLTMPNNEFELASTIEELYDDNELIKQMGLKARRKVEVKFSSKSHFNALNQVYKKLLK